MDGGCHLLKCPASAVRGSQPGPRCAPWWPGWCYKSEQTSGLPGASIHGRALSREVKARPDTRVEKCMFWEHLGSIVMMNHSVFSF